MSLNSQSSIPTEFSFTNVDIKKAKNGLIYDAEGITLIGKFGDQISAYRAKKEWQKILNTHFILDLEKDYEIKAYCSLENNLFFINCSFVSACGRYAFWRLINRQAPDAEQKLNCTGEKVQKPNKGFLATQENKQTAFVINSIEEQILKNTENKSLIGRLIHLFK